MKTRIKMLKVKIKSLAAEARIIRLEELRAVRTKHGGPLQRELYFHRIWDVRREQRASLLAYAFLRGKTLAACEPKAATTPDWARVLKLVEKFGEVTPTETKKGLSDRLDVWRTAVVTK